MSSPGPVSLVFTLRNFAPRSLLFPGTLRGDRRPVKIWAFPGHGVAACVRLKELKGNLYFFPLSEHFLFPCTPATPAPLPFPVIETQPVVVVLFSSEMYTRIKNKRKRGLWFSPRLPGEERSTSIPEEESQRIGVLHK